MTLAAAILVSSVLATPVENRSEFEIPSPHTIEALRRHHRPKDWLFIQAESTRRELRVARVGEAGLEGIQARGSRRSSESIPWGSVARIDRRHSRFRLGQTLGLVAGAVGGAYLLPWVSGELPADITEWNCRLGIVVGSIGGVLLGGMLGDQMVSSTPWYAGTPVEDPSRPAAATDSTGSVATFDPSGALSEFQSRAKASDVLRVRGTFGEFVGQVGTANSVGLSALTPDARDGVITSPAEPIRWSTISQIDRRGNASMRCGAYGAIVGAVALGALGAAVAASSLGLSEGTDPEEVVGATVAGACLGGLGGFGLGALVGSSLSQWHRVYHPAEAPVAGDE